ncbi:uncharacterized protein LOC114805224 isoform X2 [Zeugodacus cucurbitae]|nr:uncharacterized protein LOC114805224 isoform X2 [Zeugodacus cucurbitae]
MRYNRPIEKPTAQVYYRQFLETQNLKMDWSLVRLKARHLRQTYEKAQAWQNSTAAGAMQTGESTESIISRICPFFNDLKDIFGDKVFKSKAFVLHTEDLDVDSQIPTLDLVDVCSKNNSTSTTDHFDDGSNSTTTANVVTTPAVVGSFQKVSLSPESTCNTPKRRKGIFSRTGLDVVLSMHSDYVKAKQQKLELEIKMKDRELALKEKEFDLQYQKFLFEKEKSLSEERIRILEIEMKEKVALRELEMKERIAMEELKRKE